MCFLVIVVMITMILKASATVMAAYHFLSPFSVPATVLSNLLHAASTSRSLTTARFPAKESEVQGARATSSRSRSWKVMQSGSVHI